MTEFYAELAEILEVEPDKLGPDTELGDAWDSLAIVSTIALIDEVYGKEVKASELKACNTVGEIERLVGG